MVPIVPFEVSARDPLLVYAEPYNTLIVDANGFRGPIPDVPDLRAVDNIRAYVERKLFLHNLGHAAVAYVGFRSYPRIELIAEAIELAPVHSATRAAMTESVAALATAHPGTLDRASLEDHRDDLLARFANRALGDTVFRVGRDLPRKLGRDDRVVGAMRLAAEHELRFDAIAEVYRAALGFAAQNASGTLPRRSRGRRARPRARHGSGGARDIGSRRARPGDARVTGARARRRLIGPVRLRHRRSSKKEVDSRTRER